jgi:membrane protein
LESALADSNLAPTGKLASLVGNLYRAGRAVFAAYGRHDGSLLAAAIAYRVLFSVVPFVAVLVSVLDIVLPDSARDRFTAWLFGELPGTEIENSVSRELAGSGATAPLAGLAALAVLIWGASGMASSVRRAFRIVWEAEQRPDYVGGKLRDLALVALTGVLVVGAFALSVIAQVAVEAGADLSDAIGVSAPLDVLVVVAQVASSVIATFVALLVLYRVVPPLDTPFDHIWLPALLTALAFQAATAGFSIYVARFADFNTVYGPLGAVLAFLLLVYVLAMVVLLGAELVAARRR